MKLSIIVPVYGVETYIEKCAKSLVSQNVPNSYYEVIFVNDGTKDNSISVLHSIVDFQQQENFYLYEKENGGLSSARNYGLQYAKGEYIWFVDSDDWIDEDAIERIIPFLSGVDAIHFPSYYQEKLNETSIVSVNSSGINGRQITSGKYQFPVPFSIYRKGFLIDNNLSFKQGILMEDLHFSPRALYLADSVVIVEFPVYHYLQREGSIMKSLVTKKRIEDRIWISYDLNAFMKENVSDKDKMKWKECIVIDVNAIMFDAFRSNNKELLSIAKDYINTQSELTSLLKFSLNRRNRVWYWCSRIMGGNFYSVYRLLYKLRY